MSDARARKAAALAALAASKRGGTRLSAAVQLEESSLFKDAAADDAMGDFVVDDDGLGYADDSAEEEDIVNTMRVDSRARGRAGTGGAGPAAGRLRAGDAPSETTGKGPRVFARLQEARTVAPLAASARPTKSADPRVSRDALESMLDELDEPSGIAESSAAPGKSSVNPFARTAADRSVATAARPLPSWDDMALADAPDADVSMPDETVDEALDTHPVPAPAAAASAPSAVVKPRVRVATSLSSTHVLAPSQLRQLAAAPLGEPPASAQAAPAPLRSSDVMRGTWLGAGDSGAVSAPMPPPITGSTSFASLSVQKVPVVHQHGVWRTLEDAGATTTGQRAEVDSVLFYWLDAQEDRQRGAVCLYGKVMVNANEVLASRTEAADSSTAHTRSEVTPVFASACAVVTGVERCIFFLPRERHADTGEPVTFPEVYNEVATLLRRKLPAGAKFGCKKVVRNYSFEVPGVPREKTEYMKVVYDAIHPAVDAEWLLANGGKTFSHVFGCNTPPLEHLLLKRDLMGPCWLRVLDVRPCETQVSHCAYEFMVQTPKQVLKYAATPAAAPAAGAAEAVPAPDAAAPTSAAVQLPIPDLTVMVLSTKTVVHPKTHAHEIVAISAVVHRAVSADGPSNESPSALSALTLVRPLSAAQPLPADLRPALNRLDPSVKQSISMEANERALLARFIAHVARMDPDVIVGHNVTGFDLDVIVRRMEFSKLQPSRLGRVRNGQAWAKGSKAAFFATAGRLVCDTYLASRELLRETTYTLSALAQSQLGETRQEVDPLDVPSYLAGERASADTVFALLQHTENDARLALKLMFKLQVLPLTKQLTNLAGNLWSRSLRGARAERIEYLLLHEFHRLKYVVPDKVNMHAAASSAPGRKADDDDADDLDAGAMDDDEEDGGKKSAGRGLTGTIARNAKKRGKPAYTGGLVLEPKRGLYDKFVLLLDFNSLYPSIIQEYNLCFTTVERRLGGPDAAPAAAEGDAADGEPAAAVSEIPALPDRSKFTEEGVLPRVIRVLVQRRRQVKSLMAGERDPGRRQALDIRQTALKILANSMYGCLGFTFSRFYARPIAALVTAQGREILQRTVDLAQDTIGCEVIYGDTDSIMIYTAKTDLKDVKAMGTAVKREVNKLYKRLEIEIDGIFSCMLLLKKKKYAALVVSEGPGGVVSLTREMKGLDMVRRDWSVLSREVGTRVLDIILSGREREDIVDAIHTALKQLGSDVRAGKYSVDKFVITKGLNKNPTDYPDVKGQPHLQVALAMLQAGKPVNVGDHIPYVICVEPTGSAAAAAAGTAAGEAGDAAVSTAAGSSPGTAGATRAQGAQGIAARAYHPDDVKKSDGKLHIDYDWYLAHDVLQPVARLCEPIDGTSQGILAECLGLDGAKYSQRATTARADDDAFVPRTAASFDERFATVERVRGICTKCQTVTSINGVFNLINTPSKSGSDAPVSSLRSGVLCPAPSCDGVLLALSAAQASGAGRIAVPPVHAGIMDTCKARLSNAITLSIRQAASSYASSPWACTEPGCGTVLKAPSASGACARPGCPGRLAPAKFDAKQLHDQLEYFALAFDVDKERERWHRLHDSDPLHMPPLPVLPAEHREAYASAREASRVALLRSAYHFVSPDIFRYVHAVNGKREGKRDLMSAGAVAGGDTGRKVKRLA